MSRPLKPQEIEGLREKFGFPPVQLTTSIDMLGVFVHADNPIKSLTLPQLDAIFSSTRRLDHAKDIRTWGHLGLKGEWADAPIRLYGRNSASGSYAFFKKVALGKGNYKESVREQPGNSVVVQNIANDKFGIGYVTRYVRALPLARAADAQPVPPDAKHAYSGEYPLARPMRLTLDYSPDGKLKPLLREFLRFA